MQTDFLLMPSRAHTIYIYTCFSLEYKVSFVHFKVCFPLEINWNELNDCFFKPSWYCTLYEVGNECFAKAIIHEEVDEN